MNGFIEKLSEAGHLTPEQVAGIESRVAELVKAAEKDPSLLVDAHEKIGGIMDSITGGAKRFGSQTAGQFSGAAANLAALGVVGGVAGVAADAYKSVRDSLGKATAYKSMMDEAGDRISDLPAKQIQQSFNTLYRVNPEYAKDPIIAAEFVRETNRSEAYPFQLVKSMQQDTRGGGSGVLDYQKMLPGMKGHESPRPSMQDDQEGTTAPEPGVEF